MNIKSLNPKFILGIAYLIIMSFALFFPEIYVPIIAFIIILSIGFVVGKLYFKQ